MEQLAVVAQQEHLPGLDRAGHKLKGRRPLVRKDSPAQLPLMVPVYERETSWSPTKPPSIPGQLYLGPQQMTIDEVKALPQQLTLLPDPPPWEIVEASGPKNSPRGRLSRRRGRSGISPGQTSFF